jgi:isopentenyl diphosphate isomerase/L-lactate dehydrogenase-like FMN-dependent dehydrogenase
LADFARAMALGAAVALGLGVPAAARGVCGERAAVIAELQHRYGETRRSVGLQQNRAIVEVWASDRTGSWTIVVTNADGRTCLMAAGEAYGTDAPRDPETPA